MAKITIEEINELWESSEFGPSEKAGVYCVCRFDTVTKVEEILYIGSSKNIKKRVMNPAHPYRILYNHNVFPKSIFTKYIETPDYEDLEKELIKLYRPVHNLMYNREPMF